MACVTEELLPVCNREEGRETREREREIRERESKQLLSTCLSLFSDVEEEKKKNSLSIFRDRWIEKKISRHLSFSFWLSSPRWETSALAPQAPSRRIWASQRSRRREELKRNHRRQPRPHHHPPPFATRSGRHRQPRPPRLRHIARSACSAAAPSPTPGSSSIWQPAASSPSSSSPGRCAATRCRRSCARSASRPSSAPRARGSSRCLNVS